MAIDLTLFQPLAFILIAGAAFTYSGLKFKTLFELMKAHQGKVPPFTEYGRRILTALVNILGQQAVLRKKWVGIMHAVIFWGFIIITVGTLEQFVSTLFNLPFNALESVIGEKAYSILVGVQDFFTFAILVAVGAAFYRRLVIKPVGLGQSKDANFVLLFTGSLMVSILLMNAFHIVAVSPSYMESMPFSLKLAGLFTGIDQGLAHTLAFVFKWVHMLLVLGFSMYIPNSKHLHILAAGPNTFLRKLDREKAMKPIDFTNESLTQYGAAKVSDLSWKDALDYYSCTECGRCQDLCPAFNTDKPLSPKKLITALKENMYRNKTAMISGKYDEVTPLVDDKNTTDVLWACTTCRACEIACPVFIEQTDKIYEARRNLVMMESNFPAEVQAVFKNMETNASPWAFASSDRANWAEGLNVPKLSDLGSTEGLDALLWVGCAGSFDDRNKKVLRSFVNVLNKASVKFAILGTEEQCTGDSARRIGNEYLFQTLATANIETLNRYGVKKIITACPHCFNTLKNEYKDFGGNYEVLHHTQFIGHLISSGKIKPSLALNETVTFHDSCYLGRWNNVYEQPRTILNSVPGIKLTEMKQHHDAGLCCGAGGGRMWMEETIGTRINVKRTEQAIETGSTIVASACPFCMTMMSDGIKTKEKVDSVRVMDIAEIVDQSLS